MEDLVGRQIDGYQIVELIGEGVAALVYKAYQPSLDRHVAVKVLRPEIAASPTVVDGIRRAILSSARLSHPNILRIHDMREDGGLQYIVMDLADGGSLKDRLALGPLDQETAADLAAAVADALAYAHERGLIHGDLRPGNILLDAAGHPLVADFGLARALNSARPDIQATLPEYMSPEQAQGLPADNRTDVYALGIVLYEALTGHVPYRGDTPLSTLYKQVNQAPPPLAEWGVTAPGLQSVIDHALAKDPDARFRSAGSVATALRQAKVALPPPPPPQQEPPTLVPAATVVPPTRPTTQRAASSAEPPTVMGPVRALPPEAEEKGTPWGLLAVAGTGGLLLLAVIALVILLASRSRSGVTPTAVVVGPTVTRTPYGPTPTRTAIVVVMDTATGAPSATATVPPTVAPTGTPVPTDTPAPTATGVPPTNTPEPSATATTIPTVTSVPTAVVPPTVTPTVTVTVTPTNTPAPALVLSGQIVFPIFNSGAGRYEVWIANADGSNQRPVVQCMHQPDVRGDGRLVMNGEGCGTDSIWAANGDGSEQREVTLHPEDANPTWSPDGGSLVYSSTQQGDGQSRLYFHGISEKPQAPRFITYGSSGLIGRFPTWLPSGEIAYNGCDYGFGSGGNCGVWVVYTDGTQLRRLTTDSSDRAIDAFGSSLVFMSTRDGNWEIYRVRSDGSELTRLTTHPANDSLPTWSPDGKAVAFLSDRSGQWAVWAMQADGSDPQKLFDLSGSMGANWTEERITWGP
ncbi:MAG: protein kinase domain-containing protein [Anaerolineae bacterium]